MIIALLLLVALVVSGGTVVALDRNNKGRQRLELDNRVMRAQLHEIESLTRDNYDVSPLFADVILGELAKHRRKELE